MTPDFVSQLGVADLQNTHYDLALFASGYEERATHLPSLLASGQVDRPSVLGFSALPEAPARVANDSYFRNRWAAPIACAPDDDRLVYAALSSLRTVPGTIHILVDYSSMSRDWYASVLSWLSTSDIRHRVSIDFAYSVGVEVAQAQPMPVLSIASVPGFEGISLKNRAVLVLGLGFDSLAPTAVLEQMEPARVLAFVAAPAAADWHVDEALRANQGLLAEYVASHDLLRLPLRDVCRCVSLLAELAAPILGHYRVVFVPMGPKPHVLATLLTCLRLPEAGVLHVRSQRVRADAIQPTGELIITRVQWPMELDETIHLSRG
jgi:hypothetical protein